MSKRTIKPAQEGLIVRRPDNARPLAAKGEEVEWSAFWQRRLNEGDVVVVSAVPNSAQEQPQVDQLPAEAGKKGGAK